MYSASKLDLANAAEHGTSPNFRRLIICARPLGSTGFMACQELVSGCFGHTLAPFGVEESDRHRALAYLECLVENRVSWDHAHEQMRAYLAERGATPQQVAVQIDIARPLLQPWLD
jgi:hypothetical protein